MDTLGEIKFVKKFCCQVKVVTMSTNTNLFNSMN